MATLVGGDAIASGPERSALDGREEMWIHRSSVGTSGIGIERYEKKLSLAEIECDARVRASCTLCEMHGRNLACPPHSPYFREHTAHTRTATILCYRVPLASFQAFVSRESRCFAAYRTARDFLFEELVKYRSMGKTIAGCGPCEECTRCALDQGIDVCRHPSRRTYSLESLGVNLIALSIKAFNMPLEWSSEHSAAKNVAAIGAFFE